MSRSIALIGAGYWGKNILRNLYELGALHTVCDPSDIVLGSHKEKYPDINFTKDADSILKNPDINAIAVATPAETHFSIAMCAMQAGKDVYVEKPLALDVQEGKSLVDASHTLGRVLMVGHILQYHPAIIKLKQMIDSGELGDIRYIYSNRMSIGKIRIEEDVLWSFAPHDISVILMLTDQEPISVISFGGDYVTKGINDTTVLTMQFRGGVKGHVFVSWLNPYKEQRLAVVGSKAMAVFDDVCEQKLTIYPHKIEINDCGVPAAKKADPFAVQIDKKEPLKEELLHFLECVRTRKTPKTDGEEGLRVLKVLKAAGRQT